MDCCPHATAIYYVNDSDGETIIYDEVTGKTFNYDKMKVKETIQPKQIIVIFDGSLYHTDTPHQNTPTNFDQFKLCIPLKFLIIW